MSCFERTIEESPQRVGTIAFIEAVKLAYVSPLSAEDSLRASIAQKLQKYASYVDRGRYSELLRELPELSYDIAMRKHDRKPPRLTMEKRRSTATPERLTMSSATPLPRALTPRSSHYRRFSWNPSSSSVETSASIATGSTSPSERAVCP